MILKKLFKYELLNIMRNRWVFTFAGLLLVLSYAFIHIAGDFSKATLSLSSVLTLLVPLAASLFSVVYWYYSDRFTEILLTQPVRRGDLVMARSLALALTWAATLALGIFPAFLMLGGLSWGVILLFVTSALLAFVFTAIGTLIATSFNDRIRGIGMALGVWLYFGIIHDGLVLLLLLAFRDYPLDLPAGILGALNPIGLVRVIHLIHYDASLLLSYSGALMRSLMMGWLGLTVAGAIGLTWLAGPMLAGWCRFRDRDF